MNLLIDTHVLIWWSKNSRRLGRQARELTSSPRNSVWVSAASIGEIYPSIHRDPFDRMLVAQAKCENLTLMTADPAILAYDVRTTDPSR